MVRLREKGEKSQGKGSGLSVKSLAGITWQLVASVGAYRLITKKGIYFMSVIEGCISIFYALVLAAELHANYEEEQVVNNEALQTTGKNGIESQQQQNNVDRQGQIVLGFDKMLNYSKIFESESGQVLMTITSLAILIINVVLIFGLYFMIKIQQFSNKKCGYKKSQLNEKSMLLAVTCLIFLIIGKVLYIPFFEAITRTFDSDTTITIGNGFTGHLIVQILNSCSLVFLLMVIFFSKRIMTLNIPGNLDFAPWSTSISSDLIYLDIAAKAANPIILALRQHSYNHYLIIANLFLQSFNLLCQMIIPFILDQRDSLINKLLNSITVIVHTSAVITYLFSDPGKGGILVAILAPFILFAVLYFSCNRQEKLLDYLKRGDDGFQAIGIKSESLCESVLIALINMYNFLVKKTEGSGVSYEIIALQEFKDIQNVWESHKERCMLNNQQSGSCPCHSLNNYLELIAFGLKLKNGSEKIYLSMDDLASEYRDIASEIAEGSTTKDQSTLLQLLKHYEFFEKGNTERVASDHEGRDNMVAININLLFLKYLKTVVVILLQELKEQFPQSLKIYVISGYVYSKILRRPYRCLNIIRAFECRHHSILERTNKLVNDIYLLTSLCFIKGDLADYLQNQTEEEEQYFSTESQTATKMTCHKEENEISFNQYMSIDTLNNEFNVSIEFLKESSVEFWNIFTFTPSGSNRSPIISGHKFAEDIKRVHTKFQDLDDSMLNKNPTVYIKFAIIKKVILNDIASYQTYLHKIKNIQDMRKIGQKNQRAGNNYFEEVSAFIIVDANTSKVGFTLAMNEQCHNLLQIPHSNLELTEKQIKINSIMPLQIAERHDKFIQNFNHTGDIVMLDKSRMEFFVARNGALIPVHMQVMMQYTQKFGFVFFALLSPVETLTPFKNSVEYSMSSLTCFTFDANEGTVYEFSESLLDLIKLSKRQSKSALYLQSVQDLKTRMVEEKQVKIDEMLIDFDFVQYKYLNDNNFDYKAINSTISNEGTPCGFYEGYHTLDLSCLNETVVKDHAQLVLKVKVSIRSQKFSKGKDSIGYAFLVLEEEKLNSSINSSGNIQTTGEFNRNGGDLNSNHGMLEEDVIAAFESESPSASSSVGGSSTGSSTSPFQYSMSSTVMTPKLPKILKIVIQLVITMFLVSVTIATVNLGLNIQNKDKGADTVWNVRKAIDRINFTSDSRAIVRILSNMAHDYEPQVSLIQNDRWEYYTQKLTTSLIQLQKVQNEIFAFSASTNSQLVKRLMARTDIPVVTLNGENIISTEHYTLQSMLNLYHSKATALSSGEKWKFQGNLPIINLTPNRNPKYKPTEYEQYLFFVINNGFGAARQYNQIFLDYQVEDLNQSTQNSSSITLITTLVSILAVFIVIIIVSPIVSQTEERRYVKHLKFPQLRKMRTQIYNNPMEEILLDRLMRIFHMIILLFKLHIKRNLKKEGGAIELTTKMKRSAILVLNHQDLPQDMIKTKIL